MAKSTLDLDFCEAIVSKTEQRLRSQAAGRRLQDRLSATRLAMSPPSRPGKLCSSDAEADFANPESVTQDVLGGAGQRRFVD
jgi:hypothetical protein